MRMSDHQLSKQSATAHGALLAGLLALLVAGCNFLPIMEAPRGVTITNDTAVAVNVVYLKDESKVVRIEPQQREILGFGLKAGVQGEDCTTEPIVVRDTGGSELARIPPPVCVDKHISLSEWLPE